MIVLAGERQPEHHRHDDEFAHYQEIPYLAAIRRAFCSSFSRRAWGWGCGERGACFLEACGGALSAVATAAAG